MTKTKIEKAAKKASHFHQVSPQPHPKANSPDLPQVPGLRTHALTGNKKAVRSADDFEPGCIYLLLSLSF